VAARSTARGPFGRKADQARTRAAQRAEARDTERTFEAALTAGRPDLVEGKMRPPPPRQRVAMGFGGGTRSTTGEYDWFYELNPDEQDRIRRNWMTAEKSSLTGRAAGLTPDEIEDMGLPMAEWLALTRGIDAAKAVQTGRHLQPKRYGGRHPLAYLTRGDPADHGTPVHRIASRRDPSKYHDIDAGAHVQYFTANGVVHPIRASYTHRGAFRPETRAEREERYGADEAF
jgi:hypothetical protein